jgi:hypothetical protein
MKTIIETDGMTAQQLTNEGYPDLADWLTKWDNLPSNVKSSPLCQFVQKAVNRMLGGDFLK